MSVAPQLLSSDRMDWRTPEPVLERVRRIAPIALDPCASSDPRDWFAKRNITKEQNGLIQSWTRLAGGGLIYSNPEYGDEVVRWTGKGCDEARAGAEIVFLVAARTDTVWFQELAARSPIGLFWRGRLQFVGAEHGAPFPSALLYLGSRPALFFHAFTGAGMFFGPHASRWPR